MQKDERALQLIRQGYIGAIVPAKFNLCDADSDTLHLQKDGFEDSEDAKPPIQAR